MCPLSPTLRVYPHTQRAGQALAQENCSALLFIFHFPFYLSIVLPWEWAEGQEETVSGWRFLGKNVYASGSLILGRMGQREEGVSLRAGTRVSGLSSLKGEKEGRTSQSPGRERGHA